MIKEQVPRSRGRDTGNAGSTWNAFLQSDEDVDKEVLLNGKGRSRRKKRMGGSADWTRGSPRICGIMVCGAQHVDTWDQEVVEGA